MRNVKPAICVDIDNVIAQTDSVIRRIISETTNERVHLFYDDVVEFDYWKCKDKTGASISKAEWGIVHELFSKPEYLLAIEPVPSARERLAELAEHCSIHIATSRLGGTQNTTASWLKSNGFPHSALHTVKHREKHLLEHEYCLAIEDDYEQAALFARSGTPAWLLEHPWNRGRPGQGDISWAVNWDDLARAVLDLVKQR